MSTYSEKIAELEGSDTCDIDTLAARTRRAAELLTECRAALTATETELAQILDTLTPPKE